MKKIIFILAIIAVVVIGIASVSIYEQDMTTKSNLDVQRKIGSIDTSMGSPILGSPLAPITIIEFGDYQCPQCNNWYHNTKPLIKNQYIDLKKANLIFVDIAFFGPDSVSAAQASYCANDQGKYWQYHDILYENQKGINDGWASKENLKKFASQLGLDLDLFNSCLESGKYAKRVNHNIEVAKQNGVSGTPTFFIVGPNDQVRKLDGAQPLASFATVFDQMI